MRATLCLLLLSTCAFARTWSGQVTHEGQPVSGATVSIFAKPDKPLAGCKASKWKSDLLGLCLCPSEHERFTQAALAGLPSAVPVATVTTGADGTFTVSPPGEGPFAAQTFSADRALAAQATLGSEPVELALQPSIVASVNIGGLTTEVAAYLLDGTTGELARLTQDGAAWTSPPVSSGLRYLIVAGKGAMPTREPMPDGRLLSRFSRGILGFSSNAITLVAPQKLRGVVTEKGRLMPGVKVVAAEETCALETKTNAQGEFTFPAPIPPPFLTTITARTANKVATGTGSGERPIELSLQSAAQLELTFVDAKGKPVPEVEAWVSGQDLPNHQPTSSDAKGLWSMKDLTDGSLELHVREPWVLMSDAKLALKGATRLRPVITRGVALEGTVVDDKDQPVRGAQVSVFFGDELQTQATDAMKEALRSQVRSTDARGNFVLPALLPGQYEVVANHNQLGEMSWPASAPGKVKLRLIPSPFVIEGEVVDPEGKPVGRSSISIIRKGEPSNQMGTSSGPDGRFRYLVKGPGTYEVSLSSDRKKPQLAEVPGATPLKFVAEAKQVIRGVVVDAEGAPQGGVLVQAISHMMPQLMMARMQRQAPTDPAPLVSQAKMMNQYDEATTAKDGTFVLTKGGAMLLFAESANQASEPLNATPKEPARLVLSPRSQAFGRVVDWNGRPVESFTINSTQFSSPEGRFEARLPAKGSASLRIDSLLSPAVTRTVEVPGTPTKVDLGDIKLVRGFTVTGRVSTQDGSKPQHVSLEAKVDGVKVEGAFVMSDGTITLKRVPKGKLELIATCTDYGPASATAEVKEGMAELKLVLQRAAALEITVLKSEQPAARVQVEITGPGAVRRVQSTASDGRVRLEQLAPGTWSVKVGEVSKSVKLEPGREAKVELSVKDSSAQ